MIFEGLAEGVLGGIAEHFCRIANTGTSVKNREGKVHSFGIKILHWREMIDRRESPCYMLAAVAESSADCWHIEGGRIDAVYKRLDPSGNVVRCSLSVKAGKNKLNYAQLKLRIGLADIFSPHHYSIREWSLGQDLHLGELCNRGRGDDVRICVQKSVIGIIIESERPSNRGQIKVTLFQKILSAILLIVGLAVNYVIKS